MTQTLRFDVDVPRRYSGEEISRVVGESALQSGLYISHITTYKRTKYPRSIHWHFKEHPKEKGCLDATFWDEGQGLWLMAYRGSPTWVERRAREMQFLLSVLL